MYVRYNKITVKHKLLQAYECLTDKYVYTCLSIVNRCPTRYLLSKNKYYRYKVQYLCHSV